MRTTCIPAIAGLLQNIVLNISELGGISTGESILNRTLLIISQLMDWNSIQTFLSKEEVFRVIVKLLGNESFKCNALECILTMVKKGMETNQKMQMLEQMGIIPLLSTLPTHSEDPEIQEEFNSLVLP